MVSKKTETVEGWRTIMVLGAAAIVILAGILIYVVVIDNQNREQAQLEARVESCKNFNRGQTRSRAHDHDFIVKIVELRGGSDAAAALETDPRMIQLDQFSAEFFSYRQCSEDCVNAFFDPNVDDCLPASNEAGDP